MMGKKDGDDEEKDETVAPEVAPELTPEVEMEGKQTEAMHKDKGMKKEAMHKDKKEKMKEYKIQKSADNADRADHKKSAVNTSVKSPNAASAANMTKGGEESGRPAPTAQKMSDFENSPGKDKSSSYKKMGKADTADHSDKSAKSPVVSRK